MVGVSVGVKVALGVKVWVAVKVALGVKVWVGVAVLVDVAVGVAVLVDVLVGVSVGALSVKKAACVTAKAVWVATNCSSAFKVAVGDGV